MYFHFPTDMVTSTLHMHVNLNRELWLLEAARSFHLDDIISHLREQGNQDVLGLVHGRQRVGPGILGDSPCDVVDEWMAANADGGLAVVEKGEIVGTQFEPAGGSASTGVVAAGEEPL